MTFGTQGSQVLIVSLGISRSTNRNKSGVAYRHSKAEMRSRLKERARSLDNIVSLKKSGRRSRGELLEVGSIATGPSRRQATPITVAAKVAPTGRPLSSFLVH
jgi:hypothetical protein